MCMKWIVNILGLLIVLFTQTSNALCASNSTLEEALHQDNLDCLNEAYPDLALRFIHTRDGKRWLRPKTGLDILYSSPSRARSRQELLDNSTVYESLAMPYTPGADWNVPEEASPGRARSYGLLRALYGAGKDIVERRLKKVSIGGQQVVFASRAAPALEKVALDLEVLLKARPELEEYIAPLASYAWRAIAQTRRLSSHAFGIAIDLNPDKGPYWQWSGGPHPGKDAYPSEIVEIFERHGFIWGGKWHHYDMMHFEYRPELFCVAKKRQAREQAVQPGSDALPQEE